MDTKGLTSFLTDFEQRQVPFALSEALNDLAKEFQSEERYHIHNIFTVRRSAWVDSNVKITKFAKKRSLEAQVSIQSPGGGQRSDVLGKFETQTEKKPTHGQHIAVPIGVQKSRGIIVAGRRPKDFRFKDINSGGQLARGLQRTFIVKGKKSGQLLILQRSNRVTVKQHTRRLKGKQGGWSNWIYDPSVQVLYVLKPRVKIKPDLDFLNTAQRVAIKNFPDLFRARFEAAMRTAR